MKTYQSMILALFSGAAIFSLASCDVKKTEEGNLPDVDVEVKGDTKLPKYDVETADVEVGSKKVEMTVPDVDVTMPDEKRAAEGDPAPNEVEP